jgi:hypothetical protein
MRGMVFGATAVVTVVLAIATAGALVSPARAQQAAPAAAPNNTPLSFGMDAEQASRALGTTLIYVRGRPGNEMYLAMSNVKGSALANRNDGLYLQFRHGRLEGWKGDWGENRPCCN